MRAAPLLVLLLLTNVAIGQVYSWRDADGRMHYSDTPPTGADAKKLNPATGSGDDADAARKAQADKEMEFKKRRAAAAEADTKAAKEKQAAAEKQENCTRAKYNLEALESGQIRFKSEAGGGRVALDDDMRAAEIARAKAAVDSWCK